VRIRTVIADSQISTIFRMLHFQVPNVRLLHHA